MGSSWTVAVTRKIPDAGLKLLREATTVELWDQELPPSPEELDALLEDAMAPSRCSPIASMVPCSTGTRVCG